MKTLATFLFLALFGKPVLAQMLGPQGSAHRFHAAEPRDVPFIEDNGFWITNTDTAIEHAVVADITNTEGSQPQPIEVFLQVAEPGSFTNCELHVTDRSGAESHLFEDIETRGFQSFVFPAPSLPFPTADTFMALRCNLSPGSSVLAFSNPGNTPTTSVAVSHAAFVPGTQDDAESISDPGFEIENGDFNKDRSVSANLGNVLRAEVFGFRPDASHAFSCTLKAKRLSDGAVFTATGRPDPTATGPVSFEVSVIGMLPAGSIVATGINCTLGYRNPPSDIDGTRLFGMLLDVPF
jgi:hypothetical protein